MRVGIDALAEPGGGDLEADPAPGAAALEHEQVAAVGVDVHEVGIERADAQGAPRARTLQPRSITTRRADVLLGLADDPAGQDPQAGGAALGLDLRDRDAVEVQDVVAGAALPVGR